MPDDEITGTGIFFAPSEVPGAEWKTPWIWQNPSKKGHGCFIVIRNFPHKDQGDRSTWASLRVAALDIIMRCTSERRGGYVTGLGDNGNIVLSVLQFESAKEKSPEPEVNRLQFDNSCLGRIAMNLPEYSTDVSGCLGSSTPPQCFLRDFIFDPGREGSNSPKYEDNAGEVGYCRDDTKCCHGYKCIKHTMVDVALVLGNQAIGFIGSCLPS
ncbi:MAG: hypothetical protein M1836_006035 [Candelina mexicana]|nr:MAG: hypothetical protein M1836_006035 [Candelina mexicana]